jgi:hypothetical protein
VAADRRPELVSTNTTLQGEGEALLLHMGQYCYGQKVNSGDWEYASTMLQVWELFPMEQPQYSRAPAGNRASGDRGRAPGRRRSSVAWLSSLISGSRPSSMQIMTGRSIGSLDPTGSSQLHQAEDSVGDRLKSADLNRALSGAEYYYTGSFAMDAEGTCTNSPPISPAVYSQKLSGMEGRSLLGGPFHVYQIGLTRADLAF